MKWAVPLALVVLATVVGLLAPKVEPLAYFLGVVFPYVAFATFVIGIAYRVIRWARSPVPFRIPTTCGQQRSLPWIKQSRLDNPFTTLEVVGRMALEVLLFRSLFRNTRSRLVQHERLAFFPTKWLWLAGLVFHWSFLVIVLRHLRLFLDPVPGVVSAIAWADSFFEVSVVHGVFYITDALFLSAVTYLFLRRVVIPQVRYISLAGDYFPLFLIGAIGLTGVLMHYVWRTDVVRVKELATSLAALTPTLPKGLSPLFFAHFFLVCLLLAYFPFSKLVHMAGVFMSPTRNLANNSRYKRHVNPWDYPVKVHTYEEYEDEFREVMKEAGLPLERG